MKKPDTAYAPKVELTQQQVVFAEPDLDGSVDDFFFAQVMPDV